MSKKKRYKLRNGIISNQDGAIIGTIADSASEEDVHTIINSGLVLEVVENFVEKIESGKMKPKETYNEFKSVLDKD